jgi:alpha-galactosidase
VVSYTNVPEADFELTADLALGKFVVAPKSSLATPKTHLVFFQGRDWTPLENNGRRYIRDRIAYARPPKAQVNKVTYDHWFGIHSEFNGDDMLRQARRAAELGCEYFCLDAGWYGKGAFGASGKGVWDEPDPVKFPGGVADVQRLSQVCRDGGMGFGLWSLLISKNGSDEPRFDLAGPAGVDGAVNTLRKWIKTYDMTWFRFEMEGAGGLNYQQGWDEVMARITREYPDFHIECCFGGGTRFDLGNMRFCTSTWLSDHTADPNVCRVQQTGALRFWPSYMLNSAVRVHRKGGDREANAYNVISRMPGTLSFNGDVAQWSEEATRRVRALVNNYKAVRHLQSQPVFFPLPQVRAMEDWDVVCFGDGKGEAQLMYVFRVVGPDKQFVKVPEAKGNWSLVMSSDQNVKIKPSGDGFLLSMPPHTASVWLRK